MGDSVKKKKNKIYTVFCPYCGHRARIMFKKNRRIMYQCSSEDCGFKFEEENCYF